MIGARIVRALHAEGDFVVINHPGPEATESEREADALAAELNLECDRSISVFAADVLAAVGVAAMIADSQRHHGGLDILVNNAGIMRNRSIAKMTESDWNDVIDVDLSGVYHACKCGLDVMNRDGVNANVGSLVAEARFMVSRVTRHRRRGYKPSRVF